LGGSFFANARAETVKERVMLRENLCILGCLVCCVHGSSPGSFGAQARHRRRRQDVGSGVARETGGEWPSHLNLKILYRHS